MCLSMQSRKSARIVHTWYRVGCTACGETVRFRRNPEYNQNYQPASAAVVRFPATLKEHLHIYA